MPLVWRLAVHDDVVAWVTIVVPVREVKQLSGKEHAAQLEETVHGPLEARCRRVVNIHLLHEAQTDG